MKPAQLGQLLSDWYNGQSITILYTKQRNTLNGKKRWHATHTEESDRKG